MHFHAEIILPYTDNWKQAIADLLNPYCEHNEDSPKHQHAFWDWYEIGGRFSGSKLQRSLDQDQLKKFGDALDALAIKVSAVQAGKPSIPSAETRDQVDALWRQYFPNSPLKQCPWFSHSGARLPFDVCRLEHTPLDTPAYRVLIAGPHWTQPDVLVIHAMYCEESCNGVNFQPTTFQGTIHHALALYNGLIQHYQEDARKQFTPAPDWLTVTVDYHS